MYVCGYACLCICVYVCMYLCMLYVCVYVCMHVLLYLQVGNWQCVPTWTGTEEYCQAEAMGVVTGVIGCTAVEKKQQNLLCCLSRSTDRSCLLDFQFEWRVRVGKQVIKLNITITQSDPNTDVAYTDLQRFQLEIIFRETWFTQTPIKRNGFRELKYSTSLQVRGFNYPTGLEFKLS